MRKVINGEEKKCSHTKSCMGDKQKIKHKQADIYKSNVP